MDDTSGFTAKKGRGKGRGKGDKDSDTGKTI